ncbi:uncharacterized protein LOC119349816 isoform X2 [Triticum dicoccoides]|uniref:uncharacterized protein LOC119349816 isoform X2 n=1 Tax=Triticum dicoccoides TaxID=85692 RepID=UPI00188EFDED|nr:uncharacterized protein LOC119349816 isoform X2 [Triticum dicoccoides]
MLHMRRIGGTPNQSEGGWAEQPDGAAMGASGEHVTCICHCWRTLPALETAVLFRRALTNQSTYEVARWKGLFYLRGGKHDGRLCQAHCAEALDEAQNVPCRTAGRHGVRIAVS